MRFLFNYASRFNKLYKTCHKAAGALISTDIYIVNTFDSMFIFFPHAVLETQWNEQKNVDGSYITFQNVRR